MYFSIEKYMKIFFWTKLLFVAFVADARQDWRTGQMIYFGNNLQHSLLLQRAGTYKYFPSITKIHTDKENEDRYVITIHKIPRKEFAP